MEYSEKDYQNWKKSTSVGKDAESQWKTYSLVRKLFEEAQTARRTGAYWSGSTTSGTAEGTITTGPYGTADWEKIWDIQDKFAIDWFTPLTGDGFRSNVKSPIISGRIESTMNKLSQLSIRWVAHPVGKDDKGKTKIISKLLDTVFTKANIKEAMKTVEREALVHGSSPFRVYYQKKVKMVSLPETEDVEVLKDKKKELDQGKTIWSKPKEMIVYDDLVIEPVPIRELYIDPQARCLHGEAFEARWVVRRRVIHIDDFKAMYKNDPDAMNVDKVQPGSYYDDADSAQEFFEPPKDISGSDYVELLELEHQVDDRYCVVANDQLIKETPLPYNHKEISYHMIQCFETPFQIYARGFVDRLMNIQASEEVTLNMLIDKVNQSMNNQTLVASSAYGQLAQKMVRANSSLIPLDVTLTGSVGNSVFPMPYNPVGFDGFKILDKYEQMATQASQTDPTQMGQITTNTTATLGMINKQQAEAVIAALADNFSVGGLLTAGRQMYSIMRQKYTIPRVKRIEGKDEPEYRSIRLEGEKIVVDKKTKALQFEKTKDRYSFFEVKPEYYLDESEVDISIAPESLEVISKALEMQKSEVAFAQMMPFAIDPSDSQRAMNVPMPLFDARKIAQYYVEAHAFPENLLLNQDELSENIIGEAVTETQRIMLGEKIPGIAGRPQEHIDVHVSILNQLTNEIEILSMRIDEEIQSKIQAGQVQIDQMGQPILPEPSPSLVKEIEQKTKVQSNLVDHLTLDATPRDMADEAAIAKAQPPMPPQAPMSGGMETAMPPQMMPQQAAAGMPMAQNNVPIM